MIYVKKSLRCDDSPLPAARDKTSINDRLVGLQTFVARENLDHEIIPAVVVCHFDNHSVAKRLSGQSGLTPSEQRVFQSIIAQESGLLREGSPRNPAIECAFDMIYKSIDKSVTVAVSLRYVIAGFNNRSQRENQSRAVGYLGVEFGTDRLKSPTSGIRAARQLARDTKPDTKNARVKN